MARQADQIATERLPEALESLRNPTPEARAQALPQVVSTTTDEVGHMANAFNTVLRTSVETAIAHAQLRAQTKNMLVKLGRRKSGPLRAAAGPYGRAREPPGGYGDSREAVPH